MKPLFTIGLQGVKPYSYVVNNKVEGSYAPYHYAIYYFLYDKFNVNVIDLGTSGNEECFINGTCCGALSSLQRGEINFVSKFVQDQFPTLPINLTIGPTIKQEECHLINKPTIAVDFRGLDFIVSINRRFDLLVIATTMIFCLGFMFLVTLTKRLNLKSPKKAISLWTLYKIAFGRFHLPIYYQFSLIGIVFAWFLFLMLLIASCTFQTGLIRSTHFQKIDTLQDILTNSLIPTVFQFRFCRFPIEKSNIPIFQKVRPILNVVNPKSSSPLGIYQFINNSSHVMITDQSFAARFQSFLCTHIGPTVSPLYTSKKPIDRLKLSFVLSSSTDRKTARTATQSAYSAFEIGNFDNPKLGAIDFNCARLQNYYGRCTRKTITDDEIILAPLKLVYFKRAFIIGSGSALIGSIIFLFELIFVPTTIKLTTKRRHHQMTFKRSNN